MREAQKIKKTLLEANLIAKILTTAAVKKMEEGKNLCNQEVLAC
jgi:hypothetical protein